MFVVGVFLSCCLPLDKNKIASLDVEAEVNAKVSDFGASTILQHKQSVATDVGCVRYMPPEILSDRIEEHVVTTQLDVFAFGMGLSSLSFFFFFFFCPRGLTKRGKHKVIWEMYSKTIPFPEKTFSADIVEAVTMGQRPAIKAEWNVPDELLELVALCWKHTPEKRPSFSTIVEKLLVIADGYSLLKPFVARYREERQGGVNVSATAMVSLEIQTQVLRRRANERTNELLGLETRRTTILQKMKEMEEELLSIESQIERVSADKQLALVTLSSLESSSSSLLSSFPDALLPLPSTFSSSSLSTASVSSASSSASSSTQTSPSTSPR